MKFLKPLYFFIGIFLLATSCGEKKQDATNETSSSSNPVTTRLYTKLTPEQTGINFMNKLYETFDMNYYKFQYLYNGGGVAVGDINNDGLEDIYFTATQFSNRLYLNKGNMQFEDISEKAGVLLGSGIKTGVTMVDINNDGYLDIYVCRTGPENAADTRSNAFFINNGDNTFTDKAAEMGLSEQCFSNHALFFDYDNDGDLDLYLLNHPTNFKKESRPQVERINGEYRRISKPDNEHEGDRLYRNNGNGKFTNVTQQAGIINRAFGLSVGTADFNNDGYLDIFVANDYSEPDILYINNKNGTFTDKNEAYFRHTTAHSMGSDITDINNDGLEDVIVLDMLPEDNRRKKLLSTIMMYDRYQHYVEMGFGHQLMRNVLQLNNGNGTFSEISEMAGIAATDWSWGALAADLDNDGWKDIFIANGYRRDVTNMDYVTFVRPEFDKKLQTASSIYEMLDLIPSEKTHNYLYKNNGDLTFSDVSFSWGMVETTFSNGSAYADLDNDGDLDLILNNVDEVAMIYESSAAESAENHFIQVDFEGTKNNLRGIGTKVTLEIGTEKQVQTLTPTRGFFSSMPYRLHFGTGTAATIDRLIVQWQDGKSQILEGVKTDQKLTLKYSDATTESIEKPTFQPTFASTDLNINFKHEENLGFIDFKREPLLPHELSKEGPSIAVGDVDNDGSEDFYIGGAANQAGVLFLQKNGFQKASSQPWAGDSKSEDVGSLFFDADGDGDLDLYVVSGGNAAAENDPVYQDRLYLNDGKGNFTKATDALPKMTVSGSCVTAGDYDGDGDLDLFVGGRVYPNRYPYAPNSYILKNDGGKFTDVTSIAPDLAKKIGMVTDAVWADLNQDKKLDLLLVGEWMPLTILINNGKGFDNASQSWGTAHLTGWWNTLAVEDMDGDGDLDVVAGNLGLNSRIKGTSSLPMEIIAKDFDNNGKLDPVVSCYVQGRQFPIYQREMMNVQMPFLRQRFNRYEPFANATTSQIFTNEELTGALKLQATYMATAYFENTGGSFKPKQLPNLAQISPTQSILLKDFDNDGKKDILLVGNFYYPEVETGRYDAGNGLFLKGNGKGTFTPQTIRQSGFFAPKDARDMKLISVKGQLHILVANNNDALEVFTVKTKAVQ